jgi:hypothetical protein
MVPMPTTPRPIATGSWDEVRPVLAMIRGWEGVLEACDTICRLYPVDSVRLCEHVCPHDRASCPAGVTLSSGPAELVLVGPVLKPNLDAFGECVNCYQLELRVPGQKPIFKRFCDLHDLADNQLGIPLRL